MQRICKGLLLLAIMLQKEEIDSNYNIIFTTSIKKGIKEGEALLPSEDNTPSMLKNKSRNDINTVIKKEK